MTFEKHNTGLLIESFRLVSVIEIEPFLYEEPGRKRPTMSLIDDPSAWAHYWLQSLVDSKITGLLPIKKASWLVATSSFTPENQATLDTLLKIMWRDDETPSLSGGLALVDDEGPVWLEPSCCCDFGNIRDWETLVCSPPSEWTMLWIGHPWVYVRLDGAQVVFSDYSEENEATGDESFRVAVENLRTAVSDAKAELLRFSSLVSKTLESEGHETAMATARALCGINLCDP